MSCKVLNNSAPYCLVPALSPSGRSFPCYALPEIFILPMAGL